MTGQQKERVTKLRLSGKSYGSIARETGLSANTVKSLCQHLSIQPKVKSGDYPVPHFCAQCEQPIIQPKNRKQKRFCSDNCRSRWWNGHRQDLVRKTAVITTCAHCGNQFESYSQEQRKYCSHACYIHARFGGNHQ